MQNELIKANEAWRTAKNTRVHLQMEQPVIIFKWSFAEITFGSEKNAKEVFAIWTFKITHAAILEPFTTTKTEKSIKNGFHKWKHWFTCST